MATAKKRVFRIIRSSKGDFTFPTIMVNGMQKSLTCYQDRWILLPKEFYDDEYVADAIEKGLVRVEESDKIPEARQPYPEVIENDPTAKGWLDTLLNGEYTDQMKSYLEDWRSNKKPNPGRILELKNRILPLVQVAQVRERVGQNRRDVLFDLAKMETYIQKEEWQWDNVQSASRGNPRS